MTKDKEAFKNIVVKQETYDRLRSLGKMSDSYDSVIKQLLDKVETKRGVGDHFLFDSSELVKSNDRKEYTTR